MTLHPAFADQQLRAAHARISELEDELADARRAMGRATEERAQSAMANTWKLTPKEAQFVLALYATRGRLLSREALMDALYQGSPDEPMNKIVDVFACKVRKKVGAGFIGTDWGFGYHLTRPGCDAVAKALGDEAGQ